MMLYFEFSIAFRKCRYHPGSGISNGYPASGCIPGNDLCLIKGLYFFQGLQDGLIRGKDQGVVAVLFIFRELVGQKKLIKDAGGHEDGFAKPIVNA